MAIIFCFYLIKETISLFFKKNFEFDYFSKIIEQTLVFGINNVSRL